MKKLFMVFLTLFAVNMMASDGAQLYKKCAGCHGVNGEKKALNKSQVITGWSKEEALSALKGYQDGSYGGAMKGLMKAQLNGYSDEDLEKVSEHIATFKK